MKTKFLKMTLVVLSIFSCKKTDAPVERSSVKTEFAFSVSVPVVKSQYEQYRGFVYAVGNMFNVPYSPAVPSAIAILARGATEANVNQVLTLLKLDKANLVAYYNAMVSAKLDYMKKSGATEQQTYDKFKILPPPVNVDGSSFDPCVIDAIGVFAFDNAGCLGMTLIPFVGGAMSISCLIGIGLKFTAALERCRLEAAKKKAVQLPWMPPPPPPPVFVQLPEYNVIH